MARTRREASASPGTRVTVVPVDSPREFVTIGVDHPAWRFGTAESFDLRIPRGAFVRLEPPPSASDEVVARVREIAEKVALHVVCLPRRRAYVITAQREKKPHRKAREVVAELVGEANVLEADRAALSEFVESVMAKRGL